MGKGRHNRQGSLPGRRFVPSLLIGLALLLSLLGLPAFAGLAAVGTPSQPLPLSSEALALQTIWSQPESYPLNLRPRADLYRPSAEWIGRLLLPSLQDLASNQAPADDWVWIEIEQAPPEQQELIGRQLRLRWAEDPALQRLVKAVTTDIRFGETAQRAASQGNVVPERLNGRRRVGPLQSLAGARPQDDVTVQLEDVRWGGDDLRIARPPVQISGRWQGLVTIVGPALGSDQPGSSTQAKAEAESEGLWQVRHYNRSSGAFDGPAETIRIPMLPLDRFGRRFLDSAGLHRSPLNRQGWLIQGAPAIDGLFTVQALEPRALLQPQPQNQIQGTGPGLAYLLRTNWSPARLQRGTIATTALLPDRTAPLRWQPGDRALVMHLFGGIGGAKGESISGWTVTGHFAFGEARVVSDPFTDQPRLQIRYHQIYANNPNGIVAGSQDWSAYGGNLQRGWLGLRPFSDVLVPMGSEVLDAIALQAEVLAARYRSGDGQGVALVTAATSCVQDSAQALWIAIRQLRQEGLSSGVAVADGQRLQRLGTALEHLLTPFGRVRGDWAHNSSLTLAKGSGHFQTSQSVKDVLLSWRSLLPRGAHDTFAAEILRAGLPVQVLRTNQIPGSDLSLAPLAPTILLGQLPLIGTLLARLGDGLFPSPLPENHGWPIAILIGYAALALSLGRRSGFLPRSWRWPPRPQLLRRAMGYLVMPAFVEELLFRGLLLPHPLEGVSPIATAPWIALSTGLFVLYHPLAARLWYPQGRQVFNDPRFLLQCTLLALTCALTYGLSGSLWWAVLIHWLAVVTWLEPLQGRRGLATRGGAVAIPATVAGQQST